MKTIEEIKQNRQLIIGHIGEDGFCAEIHLYQWSGTLICSWGGNWEHVSVAPYKKNITPSWDDMCKIKDMIFNDTEWVVQFHPSKEEYVSNVNNCLHLWKPLNQSMPTPPSELVGVKKGQSISDVRNNLNKLGLS